MELSHCLLSLQRLYSLKRLERILQNAMNCSVGGEGGIYDIHEHHFVEILCFDSRSSLLADHTTKFVIGYKLRLKV